MGKGGALALYDDDVKEETGDFYIKAKTKNVDDKVVAMLLGVIATGFMLLQEQYPDHVRLIYK